MIDGRYTPANLYKLLGDKPSFATSVAEARPPSIGEVALQQAVQSLVHKHHLDTTSAWNVAARLIKHREAFTALLARPILSEDALQKIATDLGAKCHVWEGVGARDIEEVLKMASEAGAPVALLPVTFKNRSRLTSIDQRMAGLFADLLEAVDDALDTVPCDCGIRRREDGEHMSGCHLFHLEAERAKIDKAGA